MNILIIKTKNDFHTNKKLKSKIINFLRKFNGKIVTFDYSNLFLTSIKLFWQNRNRSFYIFYKIILSFPLYLLKESIKIYKEESQYYQDIRDSLKDAIERVTGDIRDKNNSGDLKIDYLFNYFLRITKVLYTIQLLKIFRELYKIEIFFQSQPDGYPQSSIWSFCIHNNIYCGSFAFSYDTLWISIRKKKLCENIALSEDLKELSKISEEEINKTVKEIKKKFFPKKDSNNSLIKRYQNEKRKIGLVLLHVFTDQARIRLGNSWQENYLDWLLETIEFCKKNKNVKWIFKAHPHESYYPIKKFHQEKITKLISDNGFDFIPSTKYVSHDDIAEIVSFIVTCTGTAKLEYPSFYKIPVISCIGDYLLFDSTALPLTASKYKEYQNLIKNAEDVSINEKDIRQAKELLSFLFKSSGVNIYSEEESRIYKYNYEDDFIFRNF